MSHNMMPSGAVPPNVAQDDIVDARAGALAVRANHCRIEIAIPSSRIRNCGERNDLIQEPLILPGSSRRRVAARNDDASIPRGGGVHRLLNALAVRSIVGIE